MVAATGARGNLYLCYTRRFFRAAAFPPSTTSERASGFDRCAARREVYFAEAQEPSGSRQALQEDRHGQDPAAPFFGSSYPDVEDTQAEAPLAQGSPSERRRLPAHRPDAAVAISFATAS